MEQCGCRCELRSKAKVFVHPTQLALAYAPEAVYLPEGRYGPSVRTGTGHGERSRLQ